MPESFLNLDINSTLSNPIIVIVITEENAALFLSNSNVTRCSV